MHASSEVSLTMLNGAYCHVSVLTYNCVLTYSFERRVGCFTHGMLHSLSAYIDQFQGTVVAPASALQSWDKELETWEKDES